MKYLLLVAVVLLVLWLLKPRRRVGSGARPAAPKSGEPMVVCAHCGVHLPRSDALPGRGGVFCDESHRAAYEAVERR